MILRDCYVPDFEEFRPKNKRNRKKDSKAELDSTKVAIPSKTPDRKEDLAYDTREIIVRPQEVQKDIQGDVTNVLDEVDKGTGNIGGIMMNPYTENIIALEDTSERPEIQDFLKILDEEKKEVLVLAGDFGELQVEASNLYRKLEDKYKRNQDMADKITTWYGLAPKLQRKDFKRNGVEIVADFSLQDKIMDASRRKDADLVTLLLAIQNQRSEIAVLRKRIAEEKQFIDNVRKEISAQEMQKVVLIKKLRDQLKVKERQELKVFLEKGYSFLKKASERNQLESSRYPFFKQLHQHIFTMIELLEKMLKDRSEKDFNDLVMNVNNEYPGESLSEWMGDIEAEIGRSSYEIVQKSEQDREIWGQVKDFYRYQNDYVNKVESDDERYHLERAFEVLDQLCRVFSEVYFGMGGEELNLMANS